MMDTSLFPSFYLLVVKSLFFVAYTEVKFMLFENGNTRFVAC